MWGEPETVGLAFGFSSEKFSRIASAYRKGRQLLLLPAAAKRLIQLHRR